jgi:hypothetical protein
LVSAPALSASMLFFVMPIATHMKGQEVSTHTGCRPLPLLLPLLLLPLLPLLLPRELLYRLCEMEVSFSNMCMTYIYTNPNTNTKTALVSVYNVAVIMTVDRSMR